MDSEQTPPSDPPPSSTSSEDFSEDLQPLPDPDHSAEQATSRMEPGSERRRPKGEQPKKNEKRGCGCLFLLALLIVLSLMIVGVVWLILPFNKAGYQQQRSLAFEINEAPSKNTLYLAHEIIYEAAPTDVDIAFIARTVELSGTFRGDVHVRAQTLHCAPGTVFQKKLEVIAVDYHNEGEVVGELEGRIFRQQGLPE